MTEALLVDGGRGDREDEEAVESTSGSIAGSFPKRLAPLDGVELNDSEDGIVGSGTSTRGDVARVDGGGEGVSEVKKAEGWPMVGGVVTPRLEEGLPNARNIPFCPFG